jgi:hypothetical protein
MPIGIVLLALCLRWAGDRIRLIQLIFVAGIFEAAAAFVFGGFGLQPGLVPAAMLVGLVAGEYLTGRRSVAEVPTLRVVAPLLLLLAYGAVTAKLMPDVFSGRIIVWPQKIIFDRPEPVPLAPGQNNMNQLLYLAANIALIGGVALALGRAGTAWRSVIRAYLLGGYIAVFIALWELAARVGGMPYPKELLQSNPGWAIVEQSLGSLPRLQASFPEPSAFGFYLVGVAFACLGLCLNGHRDMRPDLLLLAVLAAIFLCTSTTGIAALVLGAPMVLLHARIRGQGRELRRLMRFLAMPGIVFVLGLIVMVVLRPEILTLMEDVVTSTLGKTDSESFAERGAMNEAAWDAFLDTGGLGIGWGSTRASSAVPGLLAGSGIVGLLSVIWFVFRLRRMVRLGLAVAPSNHPARIAVQAFGPALVGQLLAAILSAPMITTPIFFAQLGVIAAAAIRMRLDAAPARRGAAAVRRDAGVTVPRPRGADAARPSQTLLTSRLRDF